MIVRLIALGFVSILFAACGTTAPTAPTAAPTTGTGATSTTTTAAAIQQAPATPTTAATRAATGAAVVDAFKAAGLPVENVVSYTAESDPNKLLGRSGQYVEKLNWRDPRANTRPGPNGTPVPAQGDEGGTVERFANLADAKTRREYVEALAKQPMFAQYVYQRGVLVVRVAGALTPDQAAAYEKVVMGLPEN